MGCFNPSSFTTSEFLAILTKSLWHSAVRVSHLRTAPYFLGAPKCRRQEFPPSSRTETAQPRFEGAFSTNLRRALAVARLSDAGHQTSHAAEAALFCPRGASGISAGRGPAGARGQGPARSEGNTH